MATKVEKHLARTLGEARALAEQGALAESLDMLRKACEIDKYNEDAWALRAETAERLELVDEAANSYFNLANMHIRAGRKRDAAVFLRKVLKLNSEHRGAQNVARVLGPYMDDGDYEGDGGKEPLAAELEDDSIPERLVQNWDGEAGSSDEHRFSRGTARLAVVDVFDEDTIRSAAPIDPIDVFDKVAEIIPQSPLLSELNSELIQYLVRHSDLCAFSPGDAVFTEGEPGAEMYIIVSGIVVVEREKTEDAEDREDREDTKDKEVQRLATLRSGAFFGEMGLLTEAPRTATVRSASDASILRVPSATMRQLVVKQPRVLKLLMRFFRARMVGALMASSPLFKLFSVEDRRRLVTRFRLRELQKGQAAIAEGADADGLYLVLAGSLEVVRNESGEQVLVGTLGAGDFFGEISLIEDRNTSATVRAVTRSWILRLPRGDFHELIDSYPEVHSFLGTLAADRKLRNDKIIA